MQFKTLLNWTIEFVKLGRPLFLLGGFVFHALGILTALSLGAAFDLQSALITQIAITATQLMTHYGNEYFDLPADRENQELTFWAGSSRVLVETTMPARTSLWASNLFGLVGLLAGTAAAVRSWPAPWVMPLYLLALVLAHQYSAPPLKLHWRGVGIVIAGVVVPGLTTLLGFYVQTGAFTRLPFLMVLPLVWLQTASILVLDYPDRAGDERAGKRTLVVKLGTAAATRSHLILILLCYGLLPGLVHLGLPLTVAVATLAGGPIALLINRQLRGVENGRSINWNITGFLSIALLIGTALLQMLTVFICPQR